VKDAVKSNDLEDNKIDQVVQAPVIISPHTRMFWHLGFAGPAEPDGQTYATACRDQLNIADFQQKVYTGITACIL